jgi:hypothetical protein
MNLTELHRKLIAAARADSPIDRVPFAFEKRIMASIRACARPDPSAFWARALWFAAAPCVAITLLLGAWTAFGPASARGSSNLSQDFENTILAAATQDSNSPW